MSRSRLKIPLVNHLDVFDFSRCEWRLVKTRGNCPRVVSGACSTVIGDYLYMFGGWYEGLRNADIYALSLLNFRWKQLTDVEAMRGSPLCKDKAGMVDYGTEMLCVMGGYGHPRHYFQAQKGASYHWDPNSFMDIGWTNELHLFHIKTSKLI